MNLAVTPEGTRKATDKWHTGFLRIAYGAQIPVQLGVIDYSRKRIIIADEYPLTGDTDKDIAGIRLYYTQFPNAAKYPENFKL